jgi:PadR family transcriptional regulator, regulatory protein PadR
VLDKKVYICRIMAVRISSQTIAVLQALKESGLSWSYGYDLSKLTGLKSGTLYPILTRLHDEGWLENKWEQSCEQGRPPRHLYRLTAAGSSAASKALKTASAKTRAQRPAYET